jgi:hypothetical protein
MAGCHMVEVTVRTCLLVSSKILQFDEKSKISFYVFTIHHKVTFSRLFHNARNCSPDFLRRAKSTGHPCA